MMSCNLGEAPEGVMRETNSEGPSENKVSTL